MEKLLIENIVKYGQERLANFVPDKTPLRWNYVDGCLAKGALDLYSVNGDQKFFDFAKKYADTYVTDKGTIDTFEVAEYNIDSINSGKILFPLYELTKDERYLKAAKLVYSQLETHPRTKSGNFWHKKIYPNQIWLDGLYMGQPFYAQYIRDILKKNDYTDITEQFKKAYNYLRDDELELCYHAIDESKKMFWCNKETGLCQHVWARAMGWLVMALVDTIEIIGVTDKQTVELTAMFKETIDGLLKYQDSETGLWRQVLGVKEKADNYFESTAAMQIAYALAKAVRLSIVQSNYLDHALKVVNGLFKYNFETDKEGLMHITNCCAGAGLGGEEMRDGSYEYYINEKIVSDDNKGVGPLLSFAAELIKLKEKK